MTSPIEILEAIWCQEGYVFLPQIDRSGDKPKFIGGKAYRWPADRAEVEALLTGPQKENHDQYFTPGVFSSPERKQEHLLPETCLWADFDESDPRSFRHGRPSICWESSPGRFQGVWLLRGEEPGAAQLKGLNQAFTLASQADPSGWDTTQLLRVPGTVNHKYASKPVGEVHLCNLSRRSPKALRGALRGLMEAVWPIPTRVSELLRVQDVIGDRSKTLWDIERSLSDAGVPPVVQFHVLWPRPWNKFAERDGGERYLMNEIEKAWSLRKEPEPESPDAELEEVVSAQWWSDIMKDPPPNPRWLVEDIISVGSCGFIAGAPKSYKSYIGLDLLVSVASGQPFLGQFKVTQAPVLLIQEEDSLSLVAQRMRMVTEGRAPEHFWHGQLYYRRGRMMWEPPKPLPIAATFQEGIALNDPKWLTWLSQQIANTEAQLVVIDTLGTVSGGIDIDKSPELYQRLLQPLKKIAHFQEVAILMVHHNRKPGQKTSRGGAEMLGSVALHAWVDNSLYFGERTPDGYIPVVRESKLSNDLRFKVQVPFMSEDTHTGDRKVWEPRVEFMA